MGPLASLLLPLQMYLEMQVVTPCHRQILVVVMVCEIHSWKQLLWQDPTGLEAGCSLEARHDL